MAEQTFETFIEKEPEHLAEAREDVLGRRQELGEGLAAIDRELYAIEAYEQAKRENFRLRRVLADRAAGFISEPWPGSIGTMADINSEQVAGLIWNPQPGMVTAGDRPGKADRP